MNVVLIHEKKPINNFLESLNAIKTKISLFSLSEIENAYDVLSNFENNKNNKNFEFAMYRIFGQKSCVDFSIEEFTQIIDFLDSRKIELETGIAGTTKEEEIQNKIFFESLEFPKCILLTKEFERVFIKYKGLSTNYLLQIKIKHFLRVITEFESIGNLSCE